MSESIFKNPYVLMAGTGIGGAILGAGITAFIKGRAIKQLESQIKNEAHAKAPEVKPKAEATVSATEVTEEAPDVQTEASTTPKETQAAPQRFDDSLLQVDISEDEEQNNFQLPALSRFSFIERGPNLDGLTERQANQMRAMASNRLDLCSKKKFVSADEFRQHLKGMYAQYHRYLEQNQQEQQNAA